MFLPHVSTPCSSPSDNLGHVFPATPSSNESSIIKSCPITTNPETNELNQSVAPERGLSWDDRTWNDTRIHRQIQHATTAFVIAGIVIRLTRYLANFPLWSDETMLAANLRHTSFAELAGPLTYNQVCPVLYLWATLAVTKLAGFNEYAMRLIPCVCAIASVILFRRMAGRLLSGVPLLLAVGVFTMSYYPVRYAGEIKPYATDLFVALVLLSLALAWLQNRKQARHLWALAIIAPLAIGFSYAAIFIIASIAIALAWPVYQTKSARTIVPYFVAALTITAAFLLNYIMIIKPQSAAAVSGTLNYWQHGFPPLTDPIGFVTWFFSAHTGRMFGYPIGEARGGSTLTFISFAAGIGLWMSMKFRQSTTTPLFPWLAPVDPQANNTTLRANNHVSQTLLLLGPFLLLFIAAVLHKYPYGGSGRITQHLAPAITLFTGLGTAYLLTRAKTVKQQKRQIALIVFILFAFGFAQFAQSFAMPYRYASDREERNVFKQLWQDDADQFVTVCGVTDLHMDWLQQAHELSDGAKYLTNQTIYSKRHQQNQPPPWDQITATRPLRVITLWWPAEFYSSATSNDTTINPHLAYEKWLADMGQQYQHVRTTTYLTPEQRKHRPRHSNGMWLVIDEFTPPPPRFPHVSPHVTPTIPHISSGILMRSHRVHVSTGITLARMNRLLHAYRHVADSDNAS